MNDSLNKLNFDGLYKKALRDWPKIVEVGNIERTDSGYCLPDFVEDIIENNEKKSAHDFDAILMVSLHQVLGVFIHKVAEYCTSITLADLRKDYIQRTFNEDFIKYLVEEWLGFEGRGWQEKDYKLAIQYLKNEAIVDMTDASKMYLRPQETVLLGSWIKSESGKLQKDETFKRITWLLLNQLQQVKRLNSDFTLYKDPRDGRYWEKTFPENESSQDFTLPLKWMTKEQAKEKYGTDPHSRI